MKKKFLFLFVLICALGFLGAKHYPTQILTLKTLNIFSDAFNLRFYQDPSIDLDKLNKTQTTLYEESLIDTPPTKALRQDFYQKTGRNAENIIGYPQKFITPLGENVTFYYAGDVLSESKFIHHLKIFNALDDNLIFQKNLTNQTYQVIKRACQSFYKGCHFPENITIQSNQLGSGEFYIHFYDEKNRPSQKIYFAVRNKMKKATIAVMAPTHTWQAYNAVGGASLYGREPSIKKYTGAQYPRDNLFAVHKKRPLLYTNHLVEDTLIFLKHLNKNAFSYVFIDNEDLNERPEILKNVTTLIIGGHDEYWTQTMRKNAENFVKKGGNIANFSGNVAWWKVNSTNNLLCIDKNYLHFKKPTHYPKAFENTGLFKRTEDRVEELFGLSYEFAGYPVERFAETKNIPYDEKLFKKSKGIEIIDPQHPLLKNLNLEKGFLWGDKTHLIDIEIDGIPLDKNDAIDALTQKYYPIPKNMRVIGKTYAQCYSSYTLGWRSRTGVQKIGIFAELKPFENPESGKVINIGTIGFAQSLRLKDIISETVFKNTLNFLR